MNTRLQVEHPVTEAITGEDLVAWQLHIAAGEPLPQRLHAAPRGHAIEVRLCSEQAEAGFLPSTGLLTRLRWPAHHAFEAARVRVDSGVREGDAVSAHYDAMLAKLIVWGEDRPTALARLQEALLGVQVAGVHTNAGFLRRLLAHPDLLAARVDTQWLERHLSTLPALPPVPAHWAAAAWVATDLAEAHARSVQPTRGDDPWAQADGWRLHGHPSRRHTLQHDADAAPLTTRVTWLGALQARFSLGDDPQGWTLQVHAPSAAEQALGELDLSLTTADASTERLRIGWQRDGNALRLYTPAGALTVRDLSLAARDSGEACGDDRVRAPLPGRVVALRVGPEQTVRRGEPLLVMEAMKMEHTLTAPRDGQVDALLCQVGDQVHEGDELLRLQA
jgi:3-methylcrotonyl-CoA carboxylase alpha subunit